MRLIVNGEPRESRAATLTSLLAELGVNAQSVACEVNLTVIRRETFVATRLHEGDRVEIVRVIGGG